jgi:hypothetical protein
LGLFCLICWSLAPFLFLQMTEFHSSFWLDNTLLYVCMYVCIYKYTCGCTKKKMKNIYHMYIYLYHISFFFIHLLIYRYLSWFSTWSLWILLL